MVFIFFYKDIVLVEKFVHINIAIQSDNQVFLLITSVVKQA